MSQVHRPSIFPAGLKLVGDVQGEDDLVVHGTIEGDVSLAGALVVEASGIVRGDVRARSVVVRGVVHGDATAGESVRIDAGGHLVGDVEAPRVTVVRGAKVRGHVEMTGGQSRPSPRADHAGARKPSERPGASPGAPPSADIPRVMEASVSEDSKAGVSEDSKAGSGEGGLCAHSVDGSQGRERPQREPPEGRRPPPPTLPSLRRRRVRRKGT